MVTQPPCILWAEKLALRREDLSPDDCLALDAHVADCPACRQAQADYHFLSAALKALPPSVVRPLPRLVLNTPAETGQTGKRNGSIFRRPHTPPLRKRLHSRRFALLTALASALVLILSGGFLFQGAITGTAHPWGTTLLTYRQHSDFVSSVAWSPDGRFIASGSWDDSVQIWDTHSGERILTCNNPPGGKLAGHGNFISAVAWSPNGHFIASGGWDDTVQVWDAHTCGLLTTYTGHTSEVTALAWSPDGTSISSTSWDHTLQVWNVFTGKLLYVYPTELFTDILNAVAWSPDGRFIVVGGSSSPVYVLDAKTGKVHTSYSTRNSGTYPVDALAWSPDSKLVAIGQRDNVVRIWDISKNDHIILAYTGHWGDISALAWSPDGSRIASGSIDHTVQVWGAKNGEHLLTYSGHSETVASVAWSPDGKLIASGAWDNTVRIWEAPPVP